MAIRSFGRVLWSSISICCRRLVENCSTSNKLTYKQILFIFYIFEPDTSVFRYALFYKITLPGGLFILPNIIKLKSDLIRPEDGYWDVHIYFFLARKLRITTT